MRKGKKEKHVREKHLPFIEKLKLAITKITTFTLLPGSWALTILISP